VRLFTGKVWSWSGTIAAGGTLRLPASGNNGRKAAIITIWGYSATGPLREGGVVAEDGTGGTILTGSANLVLTNTANKLCVLWGAGVSTIINNMAQTLSIAIHVQWSTA
jgi:hypothetical protein